MNFRTRAMCLNMCSFSNCDIFTFNEEDQVCKVGDFPEEPYVTAQDTGIKVFSRKNVKPRIKGYLVYL